MAIQSDTIAKKRPGRLPVSNNTHKQRIFNLYLREDKLARLTVIWIWQIRRKKQIGRRWHCLPSWVVWLPKTLITICNSLHCNVRRTKQIANTLIFWQQLIVSEEICNTCSHVSSLSRHLSSALAMIKMCINTVLTVCTFLSFKNVNPIFGPHEIVIPQFEKILRQVYLEIRNIVKLFNFHSQLPLKKKSTNPTQIHCKTTKLSLQHQMKAERLGKSF